MTEDTVMFGGITLTRLRLEVEPNSKWSLPGLLPVLTNAARARDDDDVRRCAVPGNHENSRIRRVRTADHSGIAPHGERSAVRTLRAYAASRFGDPFGPFDPSGS